MPELSDEELWGLSRDGDREAFGRIVMRYQSLICSLAYSRCGALGAAEDMAQETFITAWHRLAELREPGKLRPWLCGIVSNLAANVVRRELRRGGTPESLDAIPEPPSLEADPAAQAIAREEESMLCRTLGELPENYREPLILFYREQQSIADVAAQLDLSEDTVKQRLSRGRAMLRDGLATVVESTLARSKPRAAFAAGVIAALPVTASSVANAAADGTAAGKALTTAKVGMGLGLGTVLGPVVGLAIAWFSTRLATSTGRSSLERAFVLRHARRMILFCFLMSIGLAAVLSQAGKLYTPSPLWVITSVAAWLAVLLGTILWTSSRVNEAVLRIRAETGTGDSGYFAKLASVGLNLLGPIRHESSGGFLGLPWLSVSLGSFDVGGRRSHIARGWIAIGDVAISPLFGFGGIAIAPLAVGGLTLGVLSLSVWGAAVGVLAFGSVAMGWCAFGIVSAGWKAAFGGGVALAQDFAIGGWAQATEVNTHAAKQWFVEQWFSPVIGLFASVSPLIIVVSTVLALGVVARRVLLLRRLSRCSTRK